jgi:hypothetical protein
MGPFSGNLPKAAPSACFAWSDLIVEQLVSAVLAGGHEREPVRRAGIGPAFVGRGAGPASETVGEVPEVLNKTHGAVDLGTSLGRKPEDEVALDGKSSAFGDAAQPRKIHSLVPVGRRQLTATLAARQTRLQGPRPKPCAALEVSRPAPWGARDRRYPAPALHTGPRLDHQPLVQRRTRSPVSLACSRADVHRAPGTRTRLCS